jgi:hypothetical protein
MTAYVHVYLLGECVLFWDDATGLANQGLRV